MRLYVRLLLFLSVLSLLISCKGNLNDSLPNAEPIPKPTINRTFEGIYLGMSEAELKKKISYKTWPDRMTDEDKYKTYELSEGPPSNFTYYNLHRDYGRKYPNFKVIGIRCYKGKIYEILLGVHEGYEKTILEELSHKYPLSELNYGSLGNSWEYSDGETKVHYGGSGLIYYTDENHERLLKQEEEEKEQKRRNEIQNSSVL